MGSNLYAYFRVERQTQSGDLAEDSGMSDLSGWDDTSQVVARLSPDSEVRQGGEAELVLARWWIVQIALVGTHDLEREALLMQLSEARDGYSSLRGSRDLDPWCLEGSGDRRSGERRDEGFDDAGIELRARTPDELLNRQLARDALAVGTV